MKIFWVDLVLIVLLTGASARGAETFFITEVVDYSPGNGVTEGQGFGIPDRILDGVDRLVALARATVAPRRAGSRTATLLARIRGCRPPAWAAIASSSSRA